MKTKDKIIFILVSILTLGFLPIIVFAKGRNKEASKELSSTKKLLFDAKVFVELLGGANNIAGLEYTHTKVKVFINSKKPVNLDGLDQLPGVTGVMATTTTINVIVGNVAMHLAELVNDIINGND